MDIVNRIRITNVTSIIKLLLHGKICQPFLQENDTFASNLKELSTLLHQYAHDNASTLPRSVSTIDWTEKLGLELIQYTQYCVRQLPEATQERLLRGEALKTYSM